MKFSIYTNRTIAYLSIAILSSCNKPGINPQPPVVTTNTIVTTMAGSGVEGSADGNGTAAQFNKPGAMAVDLQGNVYVAQPLSFTVRKITSTGVVTTLAGGSDGYADGQGSTAQFKFPSALVTDALGNIYVADITRIRKITPAGTVTTLAGSEISGYAEGSGTAARFKLITGMVIDLQGNILAMDNDIAPGGSGVRIRKISTGGVVSTLFNNIPTLGNFIAIDGVGNIYFDGLYAINKYTPAGVFSVVKDLSFPTDPQKIVIDVTGNIFYTVSSQVQGNYNKILKLSLTGTISTYAGTGIKGFRDGKADEAQFDTPFNMAIDGAGNIYVSDMLNNRVRKISKQ